MNNKFLYNNEVLKQRRRELRNNQTKEEKILWKHLNRSQLDGLKFVRQYSIGPYILDFYCSEVRLAIEVDGGHHAQGETREYDKERHKYLEGLDIYVKRFWNSELVENVEKVLASILQIAKERRASPLKVRGD